MTMTDSIQTENNVSITEDNIKVYHCTVSAPTNIACIKYWGKASVKLNTPINSSVSVTLDQTHLRAVTTVAASTSYTSDRLWLNGVEDLTVSTNRRFRSVVDAVRSLATDQLDERSGMVAVSKAEWQSMNVHVSSYNTFPTAAGLASSAAGYAALVYGLIQLYNAQEEFHGQFTTIARMGSGSACRSLHGGFVSWLCGNDPHYGNGHDSIAVQICDENHWSELRAVILVVCDTKKTTSSTAGMNASVQTSQLLQYRAKYVVPQRMKDIEQAFRDKNFTAFATLTMKDSNQFHATCLDTYPPIFYMNDASRSIICVVHAYNDYYITMTKNQHLGKSTVEGASNGGDLRVAYTFDAGPNAVLYTLDKYLVELVALLIKFYPPPPPVPSSGEANSGTRLMMDDTIRKYMNNSHIGTSAIQHRLDDDLVSFVSHRLAPGNPLSSSVHSRKHGDVKMIYCTKCGSGPKILCENEHSPLIDIKSGLNCYQPS